MRKLRFKGQVNGRPAYLVQIDKRKAKSLFEQNKQVFICGSNLYPFSEWGVLLEMHDLWGHSFESVVNQYKFYNCINSETGLYPVFYVNLIQ